MPFDVVAAWFADAAVADAAAAAATDVAVEEAGTAVLADAAAAGATDAAMAGAADAATAGAADAAAAGVAEASAGDVLAQIQAEQAAAAAADAAGQGLTASEVLNGMKTANTVMGTANLAKNLLGLGGGAMGSRAGAGTTGAGAAGGAGGTSAADQFLPEANFTYNKVSNNSDFINPLLFSLAGFGTNTATANPTDTLSALDTSLGTSDSKPVTNTPSFAAGGLATAHPAGDPEFYSEGGLKNMYIEGRGDGTSDDIPAMVANNEFVIPADIVAALGNGSSDAGGSVLDKFVATIREHKHSNSPDELPPQSKGPLEYLASAAKKGHA